MQGEGTHTEPGSLPELRKQFGKVKAARKNSWSRLLERKAL